MPLDRSSEAGLGKNGQAAQRVTRKMVFDQQARCAMIPVRPARQDSPTAQDAGRGVNGTTDKKGCKKENV